MFVFGSTLFGPENKKSKDDIETLEEVAKRDARIARLKSREERLLIELELTRNRMSNQLESREHLFNGDSELFRPIINILTGNDPFFVMADFDDYLRAQDEVSKAWKKSKKWNSMALLNTARSGFFSSDRSIREYCQSIWKVKPLPVEISCEK